MMAGAIWYVDACGQRPGPFSEDEVKEMIERGVVGPRDLLWRDGMESWAPVFQTEPFVEIAMTVPMPEPAAPTATRLVAARSAGRRWLLPVIGLVAIVVLSYSRSGCRSPFGPTPGEKAFNLAAEKLGAGDYDGAIAHATEAIRLMKAPAEAFRLRGDAYLFKGDPEKAIADYTESIRLAPTRAGAYAGRARAYMLNNDIVRALADCTEAVRLAPNDPDGYCSRGVLCYQKRDYDQAIADFREALRLSPNLELAYYELGLCDAAKGDYEAAIGHFTKRLEFPRPSPLAHNMLAWILATAPKDAVRNGAKALEHARKACELTKWAEADFLDTLAAAYAELGQFDEAVKWEKKALESQGIKDLSIEAAHERLKLYEQRKPYRSPRLLADYSEAIRLAPGDPAGYRNRGIAYYGEGDWDRAIADFCQAVRLDPNHAEAYYQLGLCCWAKGDGEGAIHHFTKRLDFSPASDAAHNMLAWILATAPNDAVRNGAKALEHARKACELTKWGDANYLDTLAAAYAELGQFDEAVKWEKKALESPSLPNAFAADFRQRFKLYQERKPYRQTAGEKPTGRGRASFHR